MAQRPTRNFSLTPELSGFIDAQLASGEYGNASEVIRTALKLLRRDSLESGGEHWLKGGGEAARLIREHDWAATPLGPSSRWTPQLRTTVANVVNSPVPKVLMWGPEHVMLYNDAYRDIAGAKHPQALGGTVPGMWPEIWDWNRAVLEAGFRGETLSYLDQALVLVRGGEPKEEVMDLFYTPVYDENGEVGGVLCTCVPNTERARTKAALAASEAELRTITDALPVLISYLDRDHVYRFANSCYRDMLGHDPATVVGRHARDILGEDVYEARLPLMQRALAGERVVSDAVLRHRDGTPHQCEIHYLPRAGADGAVAGFHVLVFDVTDRTRHATEIELSNARFRTAMDAMHGVLWTNSPDGRMLGEQSGWAALTGQNSAEYQDFGWADAVHPDDQAASVAAWNRAVAAKVPFIHEHRVRQHDGQWRCFAIRALPILDENGTVQEWVGVHTDITHRRAAEESLRQLNETLEARVIAEIGERREAEARLAQAQKMETVGKLTGGVAHDFNNLLQVVSGNLQLLAKDIAGNSRAEQRVANAMAGVSRGSKLAAQLLAFGRRQALEPKVVNISRFVQGMDDILRRAIGEGVEVETVVSGGLWNTFIDPNQVENALLNLAINARDAMDGQGRLTIELGNAHLDDEYARTHEEVVPGQYVVLAVSDTGCGMAPDVVAKVFEPFFSTKAEGKGSGLGLSMVYGFVKQSGGHVKIYSEVGEGTTIRLYLPRAVASEDVEVAVDAGPVSGGSETVLVVEDDDEVRATVVEMLGDLGYRVLKAINADAALPVIESGVPIDLLFTDVVMPGKLKSPELARKARERLPDLAVLFTSGYTENSIVHGGRLDAGLELLSKPYTREALARKVRHVLSNNQQRKMVSAGIAARPAVPPLAGTVLLVEDDALIRGMTAEMLQEAGHVVIEAPSAEDAATSLQMAPVDVLVTDYNLPGISGAELARRARAANPRLGVVFATGDAGAVDASAAAGSVILSKPYGARALRDAVLKAARLAADGVEPDRHGVPVSGS